MWGMTKWHTTPPPILPSTFSLPSFHLPSTFPPLYLPAPLLSLESSRVGYDQVTHHGALPYDAMFTGYFFTPAAAR